MLGLIGVLIVVVFLPTIVSRLLVRQEAMRWLSQQLSADVRVGHATLGWTAPVFLTDIEVLPHDGTSRVAVESVISRQSLWNLLTGITSPYVFELDGLSASFVIPDTELTSSSPEFNLGEVLNEFLIQPIPRPDRDVEIVLSNGQVELTDESGVMLASWSPITGSYASGEGESSQQLDIEAPVSGTSGRAQLAVSAGQRDGTEFVELEIACLEQPSTLFQPLLRPVIGEEVDFEPWTGTLSVQFVRHEQTAQIRLSNQSQWDLDNSPETAAHDLQVEIQTEYSSDTDRLEVPRLFAQSDAFLIDAQGSVDDCSGTGQTTLNGTLQFPAQGIVDLLPEDLRKEITMEGLKFSEFSVRGPLNPESGLAGLTFEVSTVVSWDRATAYGIESQNGQVRITHADQQLHLDPIDVPVSRGHLRMLPGLDLRTEPVTVRVSEGTMLERVQFTEEMSRGWLRYISPSVADATSTEGELSLFTKAAEFQLNELGAGDVSGVLTFHNARVGPGPMAKSIFGVFNEVQALVGRRPSALDQQTWLQIREDDVPFWTEQGRVHHSDFDFYIGEMHLTTNGSVGLDETLDIVLSLELPRTWLSGRPLLQALFEEDIQLAVRGTLSEPRIDARPLAEFGTRIGVKAANGLLERLLDRRRNRKP